MAALFEHPWHRREFGSHLTNVIRALVLEAHGYQVTVTELAGWEHSLKNELILGRRVHQDNREAKRRLDALLERPRCGRSWCGCSRRRRPRASPAPRARVARPRAVEGPASGCEVAIAASVVEGPASR